MTRGRADLLSAVLGPHEPRIVEALADRSSPVRVARRCADLAELLAVAESGVGDAALLSADRPAHDALDAEVVARLVADGVAVVCLVPRGDAAARARVQALGAHVVLDDDVDDDVLRDGLRTARDVLRGGRAGGASAGARSDADGGSAAPSAGAGAPGPGTIGTGATARLDVGSVPGPPGPDGGTVLRTAGGAGALHPPSPADARHPLPGPGAEQADAGRDPAGPPRREPGRLVVVWGPPGAPGRTTVAVNLASELARAPGVLPRGATVTDVEVLLVDADTHAPAVGQHLALLDESSGLALAARAASQGRLTAHVLAGCAPYVSAGLRVLSGIGRASRWPEVPASALPAVWRAARELVDVVVVDCASSLEQDESLVYDTRAPQRNAATLGALAEADVVVVVGGCDPVSVQRLVVALDELRASGLGVAAERVVVVNRARPSATGGRPTAVLHDALVRFAGVVPDVVVPEDVAVDAALLAGRSLAEHAPGSPARRALLDLASRWRAHATAVRVPAGRTRTAVPTGG